VRVQLVFYIEYMCYYSKFLISGQAFIHLNSRGYQASILCRLVLEAGLTIKMYLLLFAF